MRRLLTITLLLISVLLTTERVEAQYYSWGVDPTSFRWRQMKAEHYRVIYPDTTQNIASRMVLYLNSIQGDIGYGYRHPQMSIPFVVHPANFQSNGLVMWMPRRVEFLSTPSTDNYSMPWIKQLIAHEYRHAVQYNNLNKGLVKGLSYIIGQQSSTIGLLFMPLWMMEGDAVMSETEMSTFGRGLQPTFSMVYHANREQIAAPHNFDKWMCGSYKDFIPNHYALGYLLNRHAYTSYGRVMAGDIAWIMTRRPYMVVSVSWALKRLYGDSLKGLFYDTFRTLNDHWAKCDTVTQSTTPIVIPEVESHTTYSHPIPYNEGRIIALKEDLDKPSAFVMLDSTGRERRIAYTGRVSTRPALSNKGRLWWTEYRQSALFAEKVASQLCYMDLDDERPRTMRKRRNALYPTPTEDWGIAWVEYNLNGEYSVVVNGRSDLNARTPIPQGKEVHGMAWDNTTKALYVLITDDEGMHIARVEREGLVAITRPAYTTLSDLTAKDGRLYYSSIASGRNELHYFDIRKGEEYRVSTSLYGSFSPHAIDSTTIVATSYERRGYLPVTQSTDSATRVEYRPHPVQLLLPESPRWNIINLDTVRFDTAKGDSIKQQTPPRRFRRFAHTFNIHSWAPASYDPYALTEDNTIAFNLGATIMTQNILSTMEGFLTWGWNAEEGSVFRGTLRYNGLGVNLWVNGTYGGKQMIHTVYALSDDNRITYPLPPKRGRYYSIGAGATLPLLLQRGYHTQQFALSASWRYSNGMVANVDKIVIRNGKISNFNTIGYSEGLHTLQFGVTFQDFVRQAHRDFLPPWGVVLSANYALNPTTDSFGDLAVLYGKLYTPGFGKHHSLSVAASYQTSIGGFDSDVVLSGLTFRSTRLVPRGFSSLDINNDHYVATSLNYQLPLWYPDGGIRGIIYFKRLRLNLGADYASFNNVRSFTADGLKINKREYIGAYGGDLTLDLNLFGMPSAATMAATISLYYKHSPANPKTNGKMYISFGVGLPF